MKRLQQILPALLALSALTWLRHRDLALPA